MFNSRMLLGLLLVWSPALFGASVAAKKDGVEVLAEAKKGAAVMTTLKKGQNVESLERSGMFWKVKTADGKTGFVSVLNVNRGADEGNGSIAKALQAAAQEGREGADVANARSRSAVMGVRGLDESSETSFAGNVKPNMRRVYAMEDRRISAEGVDKLGDAVSKEIELRAAKHGDDAE